MQRAPGLKSQVSDKLGALLPRHVEKKCKSKRVAGTVYNWSSFFPCTYVCTTAGYVSGVMSLQVMRDGIPQLVVVPFPLRTGTTMHVLFCLSSSIETLYCSLFCDHWARFRENELIL